MSVLKWWQSSVFYQIYLRSFADGNGDGIGDFTGIIARLDYLRDLGIDAIWLSPHYPSSFLDCGYDISDHSAVAPEYGSLADFTNFLDQAHARRIRVVIDLVLNHTSDQHPWFVESRSSRNNPKRDWYIWRDGQTGNNTPPNNWVSIFGGPSWTHDPTSDQYFYHLFLPDQPDLNWRNPAVKQAMWDTARFWLDLGVDGFRLDAIATIYEHPDLPNHSMPVALHEVLDANQLPETHYRELLQHQLNQPGVHELMRELHALLDTYPGDRVLIGEDADLAYYGSGNDELQLIFNFPLMQTPRLTTTHIRANQAQRLASLPLGAWPCNTLGNHDSPRVWTRYGDGTCDAQLARLHLALLLTLRGTPVLFNGEEIGMTNLELTSFSQLRDTYAINQFRMQISRLAKSPAEALRTALSNTRDRCRSPHQWSAQPNAGFCPPDIAPWLPVNANYATGTNVADQHLDPGSMLAFYRHLLHLRKATPALIAGDYTLIEINNESALAFTRQDGASGQICLVLLNFSDQNQTLTVDLRAFQQLVLFSSSPAPIHDHAPNMITLSPYAILIAGLKRSDP